MGCLDKNLIRSVLNELLLLKDGDSLPNSSGVCKELLAGARLKAKRYIETYECPEYVWANNIADGVYVDSHGKMTPLRRRFTKLLLELLSILDGENKDE